MKHLNVFFAAFVVITCVRSLMAQQYCGEGCVAHAVQVTFVGCGDMPNNVSVYEGNRSGPLLGLTKASSGYWEADRENFEPTKLALCSPECTALSCAPFQKTVAIDRGSRHGVCAARYVIRCNAQVWKLHVEASPGRWFVTYRRNIPNEKTPPRGGKMTPFDLCGLAYDEQVELSLTLTFEGTRDSTITLKPISARLFERGETVEVNRDELARLLKTARGSKISAEELALLPDLVTFKIVDR